MEGPCFGRQGTCYFRPQVSRGMIMNFAAGITYAGAGVDNNTLLPDSDPDAR